VLAACYCLGSCCLLGALQQLRTVSCSRVAEASQMLVAAATAVAVDGQHRACCQLLMPGKLAAADQTMTYC
jgi:hypothetical protein